MAQRRMTSLEVIDTDAFLDMPVSSQLLYFHLNARADDDGFVANPQKILRVLGAAADDLKVLIAKKFVIAFSDGVCVIKHWRVNNFVRKDIYKETQYLDLKRTLFIRPNGAYTLSEDNRAIRVPEGHFKLEDVDATLTQRQLREGKGSEVKENSLVADAPILEVKESLEENPRKQSSAKYPNAKEVFALFPAYKKIWDVNTQFCTNAQWLYEEKGMEELTELFEWYAKHKGDQFCPKFYDPMELVEKYPKLEDYLERTK